MDPLSKTNKEQPDLINGTEATPAPEVKPAPEVAKEIEPSQETPKPQEKPAEEPAEGPGGQAPAPSSAPTTPPAPTKDKLTAEVESILSEDLGDIYKQMPPMKQREFKEKGEKTAVEIKTMIQGAKVQAKKIVNLIKGWLKIIPGVNKFFLEQEAKIKTDQILTLAEEEKKRRDQAV